MILSLIFLYQLIFARCGLSFKQLLYILSVSILIIGELSIVISLVGAYVFDFSEFFDERYNFSNMKMTRELAGVFGSNNTLGMVTFLIQVFYISLFLLFIPANKFCLLFLAFIHTGLILFIGNRASMFCGVLIWLGFFLYVNRSFIGTFVLLSSLFLGFIVFNEAILKKLRIEQFEDGNLFGNRSQLINEAVQVVQQMDFFGVGFQNQRLSRRHFGVESAEEKELNFHNTYLAVVAELGFLGLLWIPGLLIFYLLKSPEYEANEEELKIFRFLKLLILVLLLVYLPVEDSINSPGSPMFAIFWLMFFTLIKGLCESPTLKSYEPIQNKNSLSNHSV
jgi:O-antigen ligase